MPHRRLEPGRLVLASHNAGKLREVAALVAPHGMQVVSVKELGLPEPAETENSFLGNAAIKALAAARAAGLPALADDSGFSVAALDGDPGVRTADWAELPGGGRDYAMAMAKVAALAASREGALAASREGARAGGHADRRAWFTCALVLAWPDGDTEGFEGKVHGTWVHPPRGEHGFGYDPMFIPDGYAETFGQMDPAEKHRISHRARAFAQLAEACLPPAG
jgi:XTP/dITP diphosphohydrolase